MKILIVGLGCSGKSTLAQDIGKCTNLPVFHLDRILWKPNWVRASQEDFRNAQSNILAKPNWIYEGFNPKSLTEQIAAADTVIYLNVSHLKLTINWLKRLWRYRKFSRPDIAEGNIERFNLSYLQWLWKYDNDQIIADIKQHCLEKELIVISNQSERNNVLLLFSNDIA